ncbi:MAG: SLBB domain-containing protein [Bacteroidota bacterium]
MLSYQMKKIGFVAILLLFISQITFAQTEKLSPEQVQQLTEEVSKARAELKAKGLSEEEVKERMRIRGIDLDNIDPTKTDPAQVRTAYQQVIAELEREQASEAQAEAAIENAEVSAESQEAQELEVVIEESELDVDDIEERVDEGQTLGEAVAEELVEETELENAPAVIYGHQIFRDGIVAGSTRSYDVKPPDNYRMGVGDQVAISIFGVGVGTSKSIIESDGFIRPQGVRPIYLKGMTLNRARKIVMGIFRERYRFNDDQIEISLDVARVVNVGIVGEVLQPTNYTIPATNNAVNALSIAGGPTDIGSVRKIELIKANGERLMLDLYKYLLNPVIGNNFFLEQDDYILVPVAEKVVQIRGAIRRPFRYELLQDENLMQLIEYAAGLTSNAYTSNVQIIRTENEVEKIIDVNLKELLAKGADFPLMDADVIEIRTVAEPIRNYVEIAGDGAVTYPGRYELVEGMKISDLINKAVLNEEAKTDVAFLQRRQKDGTLDYEQINLDAILADPTSNENITLQSEDLIRLSLKSAYIDRGTISIDGPVRGGNIEFEFDFNDRMTVSDAITMAGGLRPEASNYGILIRSNPENLEEKSSRAINIQSILANPNSAADIELRPFDRIQIFSNTTFTDEYTVSVQGEVREPGQYNFTENLELRALLRLAGGFKIEAATNKVEIFRIQFNGNEATQTVVAELEVDRNLDIVDGDLGFTIEPFDIVVVRRIPDFEDIQTVEINGEVRFPGTHALVDDNERLISIIERAGGLTEEAFVEGLTLFRAEENIGYVVFDFKNALANKNSRDNIILKPGDVIVVPEQEDLVAITGATKAPELLPDRYIADGTIDVVYNEGKRAMFYINKYAGGVSENGKKNKITVEQPNGKLDRTIDFGLFKIYPKVEKGALITVGVKPPKEIEAQEQPIEREPVDWGEIVSNALAQVSAVLTVVLLIERTNN